MSKIPFFSSPVEPKHMSWIVWFQYELHCSHHLEKVTPTLAKWTPALIKIQASPTQHPCSAVLFCDISSFNVVDTVPAAYCVIIIQYIFSLIKGVCSLPPFDLSEKWVCVLHFKKVLRGDMSFKRNITICVYLFSDKEIF